MYTTSNKTETMPEHVEKTPAAVHHDHVDARFRHPFTCIVAGPTQSGKSTWVHNLLLHSDRLIDTPFDYVLIFVGAPTKSDKDGRQQMAPPADKYPNMEVQTFDLNAFYENTSTLKSDFPEQLKTELERRAQKHQQGCVVFDDLMREMADCNVLFDMFTKYCSHYNVSCIFISQNLFHTGSNKSVNTTLFRNTHIFVIFKCPLDNIPLRTIATRMGQPQAPFMAMIKHIQDKYRYVVIRGDQRTPPGLTFTSDIFAQHPYPHMRCFELVQ